VVKWGDFVIARRTENHRQANVVPEGSGWEYTLSGGGTTRGHQKRPTVGGIGGVQKQKKKKKKGRHKGEQIELLKMFGLGGAKPTKIVVHKKGNQRKIHSKRRESYQQQTKRSPNRRAARGRGCGRFFWRANWDKSKIMKVVPGGNEKKKASRIKMAGGEEPCNERIDPKGQKNFPTPRSKTWQGGGGAPTGKPRHEKFVGEGTEKNL